MKTSPIDQATLKELLDYNPETGVFTWRARANPFRGWNTRRAGTLAGTVNAQGYRAINLFGRPRLAHRLAFLWMTGEWPDQIDHRDRDRLNNRWSNLRRADAHSNAGNSGLRSDNTSGVKGVTWYPPLHKWSARLWQSGKNLHLGYFESLEAAAEAYAVAAHKSFGPFANPIKPQPREGSR